MVHLVFQPTFRTLMVFVFGPQNLRDISRFLNLNERIRNRIQKLVSNDKIRKYKEIFFDLQKIFKLRSTQEMGDLRMRRANAIMY